MSDGVGFIGMLVIGLVAGWIAERLRGADHGLLTNLVVGLVGSFAGGILGWFLGLRASGFWGSLVLATIGAVIVLWIYDRSRTPKSF